jgi:hypothetical protein
MPSLKKVICEKITLLKGKFCQMRKYSADQFIQMPWKNGAGVTSELFRLPAQGDFI